jgi:hypothetical protein
MPRYVPYVWNDLRHIFSQSAGKSAFTAVVNAIRESGDHVPVARADRASCGRSLA